jgi:hypothetical protein
MDVPVVLLDHPDLSGMVGLLSEGMLYAIGVLRPQLSLTGGRKLGIFLGGRTADLML